MTSKDQLRTSYGGIGVGVDLGGGGMSQKRLQKSLLLGTITKVFFSSSVFVQFTPIFIVTGPG